MKRLAASLVIVVAAACASSSPSTTQEIPEGRVALRLMKTDGAPFNLASLRGKIVVVTVFSTWSDPALVELKLFALMKERFADLEVVCAVIEEDPRMVAIFEDTFAYPFVVGYVEDPASFTSENGPFGPIGIVPTSFLLDREGRIAARMDGMWPPKLLPEAIEQLER